MIDLAKPKVIVVTPFAPFCIGGVERMAGEICKRLTDTFEVDIYCTGRNDDISYWEDILVRQFKGYSFAYSSSLYKALRKIDNYSLIHVHNYSTLIPLAGMLADKKPIVINTHFHKKPSSLLNTFLRKFYDPMIGRQILKQSNLIICNSFAEKKELQEKFPENQDNIEVIYNGVSIKEFTQLEPFKENKKVILCVSRLERYKNVQLVIKALVHLSNDFRLVIVGTGSYESNLKKLVNVLQLENRVLFTGKISDIDVRRWYRTAVVFVHLSEIESFGMTCIEALAAGTPVIANNDGGGLKETIDLFPDDILSVNVKESIPEDIAQTIKRAIHIKITGNVQLFDWDTIAQQFKNIYYSLM
jgi:glycosyltransferase involved in cell wall biosynthesis